MEAKLIVQNFGPLKNIDVTLKNVNVFIGPQASGKSALAKLFTILKAPRGFFQEIDLKKISEKSEIEISVNSFLDVLEDYNINSFFNIQETKITFDSSLHKIEINSGKIIYTPFLYFSIQDLKIRNKDFENESNIFLDELNIHKNQFINFSIYCGDIIKDINLFTPLEIQHLDTEDIRLKLIDKLEEAENFLSTNTSLYVPAERNFINIIKGYSLSLLRNDVPIPKHLLIFGSELEKTPISHIDLSFINKNLYYNKSNNEERIISGDYSIKLLEAASGIQSLIPLLISINKTESFLKHKSFVIEEPELNLFPDTQYEVIKRIENEREKFEAWDDSGTIHTYTTHSPYILSALNNLLYGYKVLNILNTNVLENKVKEENEIKIKNIVQTTINPKSFTAYQLKNGVAENIFDTDLGLIKDNYIDDASDSMNDDFENLMTLLPK